MARAVAGPSGVAITIRLRTTAGDEFVLDAVADHVGRLRRADLAAVCLPEPLSAGLDSGAARRLRRERLNNRKGRLTAASSARWANAIIGANDDQYRLARHAQYRHIIGLGMRGTKSRPPSRTRTRLPGRATVTRATANNGQQHQ